MSNPFSKGWNYLKASLDKTVDDNADPKILVKQAMDGARRQHQQVSEQAAAVIGNARQLEIQMNSTRTRMEETQGQVRQSLQASEQARASGDDEKATRYESQAEQLASRLVTLEQELEQTRELHGQAVVAAEQATQAVSESEQRLRQTLAQEDQLLLQATQAEMQHRTTATMDGLQAAGGNTPTFDEIRAKIEGRYTTALGRQELAEATGAASGASTSARLDAERLTRESEGRAKLDQIRAQMGLGAGGGQAGELTESAESTGSTGSPEHAGPEADEPDAGEHPPLPRDTRDS